MEKLNSIQIPINIIDNIVDDIVYSILSLLHVLFFLVLIVFFGVNNQFTLFIISGILFSLAFIISPGITCFYSNSILYIDYDGFRIKKYSNEILFISYSNLKSINGIRYDLKSNTYF
jgi:hypothetical protein